MKAYELYFVDPHLAPESRRRRDVLTSLFYKEWWQVINVGDRDSQAFLTRSFSAATEGITPRSFTCRPRARSPGSDRVLRILCREAIHDRVPPTKLVTSGYYAADEDA